MQHTLEKPAVISCGSCPTFALRRQKRTNNHPFLIRQIASGHTCPLCPLFPSHKVNQISRRSYKLLSTGMARMIDGIVPPCCRFAFMNFRW